MAFCPSSVMPSAGSISIVKYIENSSSWIRFFLCKFN
uniref:Uncharacterized protein n=1 Tax=Rhizophora mucronata TaxID=61149 RepID=A0A2P2QCY7_RHIMU